MLIEAGVDVNMGTGKEMIEICGRDYLKCRRTALMWLFHPEYPEGTYREGAFYHLTEEQFNALNQSPNREECLEILLEAGANVNATDLRGHTVLTQALEQLNETGCVKRLIDAGADVNLFGPHSNCPIVDAL